MKVLSSVAGSFGKWKLVRVKVNVDLCSLVVITPLRRSGMTHSLKGSHSFTCTSPVHLLTEWTSVHMDMWWYPVISVHRRLNSVVQSRSCQWSQQATVSRQQLTWRRQCQPTSQCLSCHRMTSRMMPIRRTNWWEVTSWNLWDWSWRRNHSSTPLSQCVWNCWTVLLQWKKCWSGWRRRHGEYVCPWIR